MKKDIVQTSAFILEQCSSTIKRFDESYKQTGEKYNIFKVTNIFTDEVKICKVIGDLLNPKGSHYKGDYFLKYFIETINKKTSVPFAFNLNNVQVKNEYPTDINRRIDIVIEDGSTFLPIEVKIYAGDQENQVSHYAEFSRLKNRGKNIPVLYLTIEGKEPSNAKTGEYIPISFKNDILKWLNNCLRNNEIEKAIPVFEILKQLIASIKSFCGFSEDDKMEKAILELVTQSEDNIKAAMAITKAFESLLFEIDDNSWELFSTKMLSQIQKAVPDAESNVDDGWHYINIPIRNGRYYFELNYNWDKLCIQRSDSNKKGDLKEEKALHNKLTELTGMPGKDSDGFIWYSDKYTYPPFVNIEPDLYFYRLNKEYLENTTEVVNLILNFVNELNKV